MDETPPTYTNDLMRFLQLEKVRFTLKCLTDVKPFITHVEKYMLENTL